MSKYYGIFIEVWPEDGQFYYSAIQSFSDEADDHEVLAYGTEDSEEAAFRRVRDAVLDALG